MAGGIVFLAGCATTARSQQFRTFFVPPAKPVKTQVDPVTDPPSIPSASSNLYSYEIPSLAASLPVLPRPTDADLLLRRSDDRFLAGKKAFQEGHLEDARREFNRAIELLLAAPENLADRARVERRLEELTDAIYRYDADESAAGAGDDSGYDQSPLDGILDMTFPVDPSLRNKVSEQIRATVSQLPLEENDAVVSYINFFSSTRGKKILAAGLMRAGRYKPLIERVLAEEGLPQELIFLAQAESGFLPRAVSNKKCVGLWQFAKFRGNEYGLEQTSATDDRMDPEKATRAAARHLHDLYSHFGDWYLAMAAYNCGPGCVDHAVMRTGYADFWSLRRLNVLPKETANYVPLIVAMTVIAKNARDYGLDNLEIDAPLAYDTLELPTPTHIALVAEALDLPVSDLRSLNPGLLRPITPAGYALHVPQGAKGAVEAALAVIPPSRRDAWRLHRVEGEETLAALAKRFGTTAAAVNAANRDELPEAGAWVAIPVAYPGDRNPVPARRTAVKKGSGKTPPVAATQHKPAHSKTASASKGKAVTSQSRAKAASTPQKGAPKTQVRRASAAKTPVS